MLSPLEQFDVIMIVPLWLCTLDLSITNLILSAISTILFLCLFVFLFNDQKLIPKNLQIVLENIILFIFRLIDEQLGKSGYIYLPFLLSLFLFILFFNLCSLLPFGFAVTSHLIWTLYFSLSICLGIFFLGLMKHGIEFLKLFVPEVPLLLYPLMISIEILSYIIRSFSLAIRLTANIIAGHTLVYILSQFIITLCSLKKIIVVLPYILLFAVFVLEFGVACLQAYIFTVLICLYINDAIHLAEH